MFRAVLLGLVVASAAVADKDVTQYFSISGGGAGFNDQAVSSGNEIKYSGGGSVEVAYGIKLDQGEGPVYARIGRLPARIDIALSSFGSDVDTVNGMEVSSCSISVGTLMLNGAVDFPMGAGFVPYLTAGFGYAGTELKEHDERERDGMFAGQVGAGLGYEIDQHWVLDLKYRYYFSEDFESDAGTTLNIEAHQLLFGVRYQF